MSRSFDKLSKGDTAFDDFPGVKSSLERASVKSIELVTRSKKTSSAFILDSKKRCQEPLDINEHKEIWNILSHLHQESCPENLL